MKCSMKSQKVLTNSPEKRHTAYLKARNNAVCAWGGSMGDDWGNSPLKPMKVTFFTMILYKSENSIFSLRAVHK